MLDQPIAQIFQIVDPFSQVGIDDQTHPRARVIHYFLNRGLGGQPAVDGLTNSAQPTPVLGDLTIGLQHVLGFAVGGDFGEFEHVVERAVHRRYRLGQAIVFVIGVFGEHSRHGYARQMQHRLAHRQPAVDLHTLEPCRQDRIALCRRCFDGADQLANRNQLGDHHRNHLERFDLFIGVLSPRTVLNDENAAHPAAPNNRDTEQRVIGLLAGSGR